MTESIRLATFNVENLFARYRFREGREPLEGEGFTINQTAFDLYEETAKKITARAIKEVKADIICLQEVENLPVLDRFNSRYLGGREYRHRMVIDGNDPRMIDVAVLSRHPLKNVRTHRHERNEANSASLFSRDCLEVDVDVNGKTLTLYVNHFKSMMGGREQTRERREEQVGRVAGIVDERWKSSGYGGNFAVLGDFNDYLEGKTSLTALVNAPHFENILERLPSDEQWTHYWAGGGQYRQLDYILLPTALDGRAGSPVPQVMRKGLPWRAERYDGPRFDDVGESNPKASDHAPLYVDLPLSALT